MSVSINQIASAAITKPETVWATYELARSLICEGIAGDFVECGVYSGAHPAAMAKAIMDDSTFSQRKVHLFDSFQGICMSGPNDKIWNAAFPVNLPLRDPEVAERTSSGISACSRRQVEANMAAWGIDPDILVYHEGWFADTVPIAEIDRIALLRLDADLYEPTRLCLEHLYPKLSYGAWCICDDWTLDGCQKAVMPYLMAKENCPVYWRAL